MALPVEEVQKRIANLANMSDLELKDFCEEDGLADSLAQKFGKDDLKPTQLYKVFQELKHVERIVKRGIIVEEDRDKDFDRGLILSLLPTMAYNSARGHIPKAFYEIIRDCLKKVKTNGDFLRVVELISAVLAYHKFRHP